MYVINIYFSLNFDRYLLWDGETLKSSESLIRSAGASVIHLTLHLSDHLHDGLQGLLGLALHLVLLHDDPALSAPELLLDLERDEITLRLSGRAGVPVDNSLLLKMINTRRSESSCFMFGHLNQS